LKKLGVIFLLMSLIFVRLIFSFNTNQVSATFSYQTDFNNGTWLNRTGGITTSTTASPFKVTTNGHEFLLSYGSKDGSNNVYLGAPNNNNANSYFKLNSSHLHDATIQNTLIPFRTIGSYDFEMVVAMNTSFYYVTLNDISLTWSINGTQTLNGALIYSIDEGVSWQKYTNEFEVASNISPKSLIQNFDQTITYSAVRLGYYFGVTEVIANTTHYLYNPTITINYNKFSDLDAATTLKDEVILYTPCITDEDNLLLLSSTKKNEFIRKYDSLSANAKSLFAGLSIGGGYTALDRYLLLTR
jgi:hypothetical protein